MCFRRVVWGTGLRIFYVDSMVALRRLTADFIHEYIKRKYDLPIPVEFQDSAASRSLLSKPEFDNSRLKMHTQQNHNRQIKKPNKVNRNQTVTTTMDSTNETLPVALSRSLTIHGRPLHVLFMSRGDTGVGRSLKNERVIVNLLRAHGARVVHMGEDPMALEDQLGNAVHADVVR